MPDYAILYTQCTNGPYVKLLLGENPGVLQKLSIADKNNPDPVTWANIVLDEPTYNPVRLIYFKTNNTYRANVKGFGP